MDDLLNVKTVNDCIEIAEVDAYDEGERVQGWLNCFEDIFNEKQTVEVFGEKVNLIEFDLFSDYMIAICEKKKKKAKITLDSIKFINATNIQKLWVKAYIDRFR